MAGLASMTTIAILGAGKIGEALLAGVLSAGRTADSLLFTERYPSFLYLDRVATSLAGLRVDTAAMARNLAAAPGAPSGADPHTGHAGDLVDHYLTGHRG